MTLIEYFLNLLFYSELSSLFYGFIIVAFGGYIILAGGSFCYFYIFAKKQWESHRIQEEMPHQKDLLREVWYSFTTTLVFIFVSIFAFAGIDQGYLQLYFEVNQYGLLYFIFSAFAIIILHDAFFYWAHRFMHSSHFIYRIVHRIHHLSRNPSPFAIHAFSPLEAAIYSLFVPLVLFIMPIHVYILLFWFFIETVVNIGGHLGYELFPKRFFLHPIFKWLNFSTHHNLHHQRPGYGFGHYFNFWDWLMGTNDPKYKEAVEKKSL